ncbi:MAG: family 78 glycoside hydrolase catalytic domain [Clostridia bacterium]|nr:family 78 glycoside hydrolase catalytic domain [Clostridia bacterium]
MKSSLLNAKWIGSNEIGGSPILSRCFSVKHPAKAELLVTGLGYFTAQINGKKVSEDRLVPVLTDFEPRSFDRANFPVFDQQTHRIYYYRYDVTALLQEGENRLEIQLGNGWYHQKDHLIEGYLDFGDYLKAIYSLCLVDEDGKSTILSSDGSETWRKSNIIDNNLYHGEIIDATFCDKEEKPVSVFPAPDSLLCEAMGTPDRIIRTIHPQKLGEKDYRSIYDCGENITGVVRITAKAPKGNRITLRFAENLEEKRRFLEFSSTGHKLNRFSMSGRSHIMSDTFVCSGETDVFEPKFTWHCFRYFDVVSDTPNAIEDMEVLVIHSDCAVTSSFESSSEALNFLYDAWIRTQLDNMHGSLPSDCPHRERLGYTGDGQICAEAGMLLLDSREFYRKWIQDIWDSQDTVRGHVPHTAPYMGGGGGPGGWGCAVVVVPYQYWRIFGDTDMLCAAWKPMKHWLAYLDTVTEDGLIVREEKGGWCLGDWAMLGDPLIPEPFVNTCYQVHSMLLMVEMATAMGWTEEAEALRSRVEEKRDLLRKTYRDPATGHYCNGVQGADAYAAWIGLESEETAALCAARYDELGYFDTGFLGTDILCEVLAQNGYVDSMLALLETEREGSYLNMKRHGATTLWEYWEGIHSHCHPMYGACVRQLFTSILGITQEKNSAGFQELVIAPKPPKALSFAKGSLTLPCGTVSVSWHQEKDGLRLNVSLPQGVSARLEWNGQSQIITGENNSL